MRVWKYESRKPTKHGGEMQKIQKQRRAVEKNPKEWRSHSTTFSVLAVNVGRGSGCWGQD